MKLYLTLVITLSTAALVFVQPSVLNTINILLEVASAEAQISSSVDFIPDKYAGNIHAPGTVISGQPPGQEAGEIESLLIDARSITATSCSLSIDFEAIQYVCAGECTGSVSVTVMNALFPLTYTWSNGSMDSVITDLCAGDYFVTVNDADGCVDTGSVSVTETILLQVNAGSTPETAPGAGDGTAWAAPTGGTAPYAYAWSTGSMDSLITGLPFGEYGVTVTDANFCTATQSVSVTVSGCMLSLTLEAVQYVCAGECTGSVSVTPVNAIDPVTYSWNNGSATQQITDLCPGEYVVTIQDAVGCTATGSVSVTETIPVDANAGSTDVTAPGANDGTAWAAPTGGVEPYSYAWSTGSMDSVITGLSYGTYTVTVTDAISCMDTQSVNVDVLGCMLSLEFTVFDYQCAGECTGSVSVTPVNAVDPVFYSWSNGDTGVQITGLCAGEYTVTVNDAAGCMTTGSVSVTESTPVLPNAGSTDETAPVSNDGTAWASPSGGTPPYSYLWSNGAVDSLITGLTPGIYTVTVTDANGCNGTQEVSIEQFACFGVALSTTGISCFGACDGTISASVIGGVGIFIYLWNTGETGPTIEDLCAETYAVSILDTGQGCTGSASFTLTQPDLLDATVDQIVHLTDSTVASISITPFGGTPPYSFMWMGPDGFMSTDEDISDIPVGFYIVSITDANGCALDLTDIEIRDETVGVFDIDKLQLRVYPNPANDLVQVELSDIDEFEIQLYSADGRIIRTWSNTRLLDVRELNSGLYLLKINANNKYITYRLIVQK